MLTKTNKTNTNNHPADSFIFPSEVEHFPNSLEYAPCGCWEAACFRNIGVDDELKTLILYTDTDERLYIVHLLGHSILSENKAKHLLSSFRLAPEKDLFSAGLEKGIINPFNLAMLNLEHSFVLIDVLIFSKIKVYTNDGTHYGSIRFPPSLLEKLYPRYIISDLSQVIYFGVGFDSAIEFRPSGGDSQMYNNNYKPVTKRKYTCCLYNSINPVNYNTIIRHRIQVNRKSKKIREGFNAKACAVQVSVGSPNYEIEKLKVLLLWCAKRYDEIIICVNDLLQRHDVSQESPDLRTEAAQRAGRYWLIRNLNVILNICGDNKRIGIVHWKRWLWDQSFATIRHQVQACIDESECLRVSIIKDVQEYISRQYSIQALDRSETAIFNHSMEYIIEELTVFEMQKCFTNMINVHAGGQLECLRVLEEIEHIGLNLRDRLALYLTYRRKKLKASI
jgi:tRNA-dependent cyclodipeptide synthase